MTEMLPIADTSRRAKLSADDYMLLDRHGAFESHGKTELINGDIYFVNAQLRPHGRVKMELYDALRDALRRIHSPLRPLCEVQLALSPVDRPEPDIVLTSEPDGDGPVPLASVSLLIEVSDTSLRTDLGRKLRRYAAMRVPEYWVADVNGRVIHRLWSPAGSKYRERDVILFGSELAAATIAGLVVDTAAL